MKKKTGVAKCKVVGNLSCKMIARLACFRQILGDAQNASRNSDKKRTNEWDVRWPRCGDGRVSKVKDNGYRRSTDYGLETGVLSMKTGRKE